MLFARLSGPSLGIVRTSAPRQCVEWERVCLACPPPLVAGEWLRSHLVLTDHLVSGVFNSTGSSILLHSAQVVTWWRAQHRCCFAQQPVRPPLVKLLYPLSPPSGSRALSFLRDNPGAGASLRVSSTPPAYFLRTPVLLLPPLLLCKNRSLLPLNYQNLPI